MLHNLPFENRIESQIQAYVKFLYTIRKQLYLVQFRINDPRSLRSWCIKGTDQSTLGEDSSVRLMHHDPSDLGSLILIWIIPKKRNPSLPSVKYNLWLKNLVELISDNCNSSIICSIIYTVLSKL